MAGHNGGPASGTLVLSSAVLADHVERQLDELAVGTSHIVGNSLWLGRVRTRTTAGARAATGTSLARLNPLESGQV